MTNGARPGEIDALVSSVRNLVAHKEPVGRRRRRTNSELLILTQSCRVDGEEPTYVPIEEVLPTHDEPLHKPVETKDLTFPPGSNVLRLDPGQSPQRAIVENKIAALEAAVTSQPEEWEADEGEAFAPDAWAASAFQTPSTDSPESTPESATDPSQERAEMVAALAKEVEEAIGIGAAPQNPVAEMDVETLRIMVSQMIRQELAGELGEKITRNVRKLVRREINRVLASKDLG